MAPTFVKPLDTMKCKDSQPVTLKCQVEGNPMPTIAWYRQSTPIPLSEDFEMEFDGSEAMLMIREVFPEDSGKYTCVAKNVAGMASTSAELLVEGTVQINC